MVVLSFHTGEENLLKLFLGVWGVGVGKLLDIDKDTLNLVKLDYVKVQISCREVCHVTQPV